MVRVLILGTGGMAANHVEAFAPIPAVTLAAGVDTRPGPLAEFCDRFGIDARFTSLEEASPSVRAVSMDAGAKLMGGAQGRFCRKL